ncbi:hypothetical protein [Krasilnikovia sp. M28-CT-15]|uniref:hypothetical protein n=1 Tax=Krasilnikovia sp. M28-CT-15 TaxID=3373540 RepID=UPI0038770009
MSPSTGDGIGRALLPVPARAAVRAAARRKRAVLLAVATAALLGSTTYGDTQAEMAGHGTDPAPPAVEVATGTIADSPPA